MKKFILGFVCGAVLFAVIGVIALTYTAEVVQFPVFVNGEEFTSDPMPVLIEGRTFLPLRAMGEALGVDVYWNEELRQVEVGTRVGNDDVITHTSDGVRVSSVGGVLYVDLGNILNHMRETLDIAEGTYGVDIVNDAAGRRGVVQDLNLWELNLVSGGIILDNIPLVPGSWAEMGVPLDFYENTLRPFLENLAQN